VFFLWYNVLFGDLLLLYDTFVQFSLCSGRDGNALALVIGIVVKVEWNTFVLSVVISHLAYFRTEAPKYRVFCVFKQISSALTTDVMTANMF
jgi:hypothetical protein